ncbi:MAG: glutamate-1-semialdehyde 2,1-aminomutase [Myxococcota bacterium]
MKHDRSKQLFDRASAVIPGGVNSPVRAFKAVGGEPIFIARGEGPYIYDADGNRYIDYVLSWGPLIMGHAPTSVVEAVQSAAREGTSFGWATGREVELAKRVIDSVESVEKVRFVNSGTEATMSAVRVARGVTGRSKFIKFAGCYHGHADAFLSESAGSGIATLGIPGSAGVPEGAASDTLTLPFNDIEAITSTMKEKGSEIAAIIVEPVAANMGLVLPIPGFLETLRELCDAHGTILIFDEVMTGFRLSRGGAQQRLGIKPDLSTFGKVIGGGLPVGAYGGRLDLMDHVAPVGPVYQAGTLSGNPLAMAAGIAALDGLSQPGFFDDLERSSEALEAGIAEVLEKHGNPARVDRIGSMFGIWFKQGASAPPKNYDEVKQMDTKRFGVFFRTLLDEGIAMAPSAFEVGFLSSTHQQTQIDATVTAMDRALGKLKSDGVI